jgi:predicted unusual protein kinase regulating ubiquinone biosynthesis (AarF/ABC1/UbiB family)
MKVKKRFRKVLLIATKILLDFNKDFKLRKKKGFEYSRKKMEPIHTKRAKELYHIAIDLGGVLIKMCQYLSTRRDIFPAPYINILASLQDNVPPIDYDIIKKIIEKEYEGKIYPFSEINEIPLASASLGQTHLAKLKTGENVVLKVLKPQVEKIIDTDFAIFYYVFKIFSHFKFFKENVDFQDILAEFIKVTGNELNFSREIYVSKIFKESLKCFNYIHVPYVYEEFSNSKIIVMEFMDGVKITNKENWESKGNDPAVISRRIIEIYAHQFLEMKLIHFDPHPGNILIMENNEIALIDFGMSGEISEKMSEGIKDALTALAREDYEKILLVLKDLGFMKNDADINILLPVVEYFFGEVLESIQLEQSSMQGIDLSPVIDDLVEIIYTQPLKLPYEWAYIGRTVSTVAGIISSIYPEFKVYDELKPYFDQFLKDNIFSIIEKSLNTAKDTFNDLLHLPGKATSFIKGIERGKTKFKVDFEEVDERLNNLSSTIARGISLGLSFLSGTVAYVMHILNQTEGLVIFGGISFISFIYFLIYRKRSKREMIKRSILK